MVSLSRISQLRQTSVFCHVLQQKYHNHYHRKEHLHSPGTPRSNCCAEGHDKRDTRSFYGQFCLQPNMTLSSPAPAQALCRRFSLKNCLAWLRRSSDSFAPRRPGFHPRTDYVWFMVRQRIQVMFFCQHLEFCCQSSLYQCCNSNRSGRRIDCAYLGLQVRAKCLRANWGSHLSVTVSSKHKNRQNF